MQSQLVVQVQINLITGIDVLFDSVPVIYITGKSLLRLKNNKKLELGFQETEIVSIVKSITKYAKNI